MGLTLTTTSKVIYIGPNLSDHSVKRYQVFEGGIPDYLEDKLNSYAFFKRLFVPISSLVSAEKELNTPGTPLFKYFHEMEGK